MLAEQRKDYRITLKVRNANLLRAIEDIGESPGQIFAEKVGINYPLLNDLIGCKVSPIKNDGDYREGIFNLCEYLNKMPCELFSEEQLEPIETNRADIELTSEQCAALQKNYDPQEMLEESNPIFEAIDKLTKREAMIIKRRFGLEGPKETLDEIRKSLGVGRERIRQIESRALKKLRSPGIVEIIKGNDDCE